MSESRISIRQFARLAGISHTRARQLIQDGILPAPDRAGLPYMESMEAWAKYSASKATWKEKRQGSRIEGYEADILSDEEMQAIAADLDAFMEEAEAILERMERDCEEFFTAC